MARADNPGAGSDDDIELETLSHCDICNSRMLDRVDPNGVTVLIEVGVALSHYAEGYVNRPHRIARLRDSAEAVNEKNQDKEQKWNPKDRRPEAGRR